MTRGSYDEQYGVVVIERKKTIIRLGELSSSDGNVGKGIVHFLHVSTWAKIHPKPWVCCSHRSLPRENKDSVSCLDSIYRS
jgi:hypothetical protein